MFLLLAILLFGGCVPLPETAQSPRAAQTDRAPFKLLDPGAYEQTSLHFSVKAYGSAKAQAISARAEDLYQTLMMDTNLFSFMPAGLYELVVYGTHEEYMAKTGQPEWSGGVAYGNAIYSYEGPQLGQVMAHEMTHLIFGEFMGRPRPDLLWVNEGLATYEQAKAAGGKNGPAELFPEARDRVRNQPASMAQLTSFVPLSSGEAGASNVSAWYAQSQSMVEFLIQHGGRLGFSQLLQGLKDGRACDEALRAAYAGLWTGLDSFYAAWRKS